MYEAPFHLVLDKIISDQQNVWNIIKKIKQQLLDLYLKIGPTMAKLGFQVKQANSFDSIICYQTPNIKKHSCLIQKKSDNAFPSS